MKRRITHTDHCNIRTATRDELIEFIEALEQLYFDTYQDTLAMFGSDSKYTETARLEWHGVLMVVHKLLH